MAGDVPQNTSVKLDKELRARVKLAMKAKGIAKMADLHRQALVRYCRETEDELRAKSPEEYRRIYGPGLGLRSSG